MFLQRLETFLWPDVGREDRGLVKWAMDEENENMQGEMDVSKERWSLEFCVLGYREGTVWSVSEVLAVTASEQVRCWGKHWSYQRSMRRPLERGGLCSGRFGDVVLLWCWGGTGEQEGFWPVSLHCPLKRRRRGVLVTALASA